MSFQDASYIENKCRFMYTKLDYATLRHL